MAGQKSYGKVHGHCVREPLPPRNALDRAWLWRIYYAGMLLMIAFAYFWLQALPWVPIRCQASVVVAQTRVLDDPNNDPYTRENFALRAAGAKIIPTLTSPTWNLGLLSFKDSFLLNHYNIIPYHMSAIPASSSILSGDPGSSCWSWFPDSGW
ncbi:hypothetical protein CYLTODRAFT_226100 [Cylindrobasidium torrendii FP15055 ss-10]|uniref:Uncharacterized protein n=1 Tax=Cylindrobasidium torrendii FP15055 ss-10 TaxID=1314674 RepID=A0A0D7AVT9_9AGAR|nr:hypothetical protein CYLTODRAFT_226100 [Cylindrobasidium torrendii FP15055 ss-10]